MDTIGKPKDIHELQKHYQDLFTCYSALQRDHNRIIAKHKASLQVIGKQKKEIQSLKLRYASPRLHRHRTGAGTRQTKAGGCQKVLDVDVNIADVNIADSSANKENVENALGQLQTRLSSAEGELQALRSNPRNGDSKTEEHATKLHLLQAQHELDEVRIQAQAEKLEKILRLHKEYTARHAALRKELHLHQEENEELEFQVAQLEECKEQVEELTHHNCFLEDKVRQLSKLSLPKEGDFKRERCMLVHQLKEKQRVHMLLEKGNKELRGENKQLRSELTSAEQYFSRNRPCSTPPAVSNRLGDVWQQLDHAQQENVKQEDELQQVHQTLQSQIAMNSALQQKLKDTLQRMKVTETTTEEQAAQRLQRIQFLESQLQTFTQRTGDESRCNMAPPNNFTEGEHILEVSLHSAALRDLPEGTKSFAILDFHSFGSKLSDIVSGTSPAFNFTVKYEIKVDAFSSCLLAKEGVVRVELYILQQESAPGLKESQEAGVLFAYSSVSISALLHPSAAIYLPRLELTPVKEEHNPAGSVSVSMRLGQPTPPTPTVSPKIARGRDLGVASCRRHIVRDAVSIVVESVTLSNNHMFGDDDSFYVHYRFLNFGDVLTNLEHANNKHVITFRTKSTFPILLSESVSLEMVLSAISKGVLRFALFSGSKNRGGTRNESEPYGFRCLGEAQLPLRNIWGHKEFAAEIVSLEARVVGSLAITFETTVQPIECWEYCRSRTTPV